MGNPDLQLRTDSLGFTPLLAPMFPLAPVRTMPLQPQLFKRRHSLGETEHLSPSAQEVAQFDCSSSNESNVSIYLRQDSQLTGGLITVLPNALSWCPRCTLILTQLGILTCMHFTMLVLLLVITA